MTKHEASLFWDFCNYTDRQFKKYNIVRKYTGEPYFNHCAEVYVILYNAGQANFVTGCVAVGHDLLEDIPGLTYDKLCLEMIKLNFNIWTASLICDGIKLLTDEYTTENYPNLNRATRKDLEALRLSKVPPRIQNIKLADLISNTKSIADHDEKFAETYLKEKKVILSFMKDGDSNLFLKAQGILEESEKKLKKNLEMI